MSGADSEALVVTGWRCMLEGQGKFNSGSFVELQFIAGHMSRHDATAHSESKVVSAGFLSHAARVHEELRLQPEEL